MVISNKIYTCMTDEQVLKRPGLKREMTDRTSLFDNKPN